MNKNRNQHEDRESIIREKVILHTFDPPPRYVHWPSVWLGIILAALAVALWLLAGWAQQVAVVAAPITLSLEGREPETGRDPVAFLTADDHPPPLVEAIAVPAPEPSLPIRRITVYGPPAFPKTNYVARWFGLSRAETGFTIGDALDWAAALGLDGICAASPGTPWYGRVRDDMPPVLDVEGHGRYLCVDRTALRIRNTIDLWVPDPWPGGTYFREWREVSEVKLDDNQ